MEVVMSPGRFGDEAPGVPFQKEEIREWSHVDRLTGMLERARVETGRWQTSNHGAAKSYGKVIDSRERNSADGSVVQRARRQVEIFQSQGRGRSVQVVRASQWSSSRVTDFSTTNSSTLPVLNKAKEADGVERKIIDSPLRLEKEKDCAPREEAISERLSSLLGSLTYPVSSTVPLRRIDSKYSSRAAILNNSKKSNSNEDLSILSLKKTNEDLEKRNSEMDNFRSNGDGSRLQFYEEKLKELKRVPEVAADGCEKNSSIVNREDKPSKATKSAIQLLPSSKSNTTVINLIKDTTKPEMEVINDKHSRINWMSSSGSSNFRENRTNDSDNSNSCRETTLDDSTIFLNSAKIPKRVGFCKTEIHFAADSGKVNIVETDEKPPPTNKFRRRRRLTGIANNNNIPNLNLPSYETKINDKLETSNENRFESDDNARIDHQRGHTTTVKLGNEIIKNEERGFPDGQYCKGHQEISFPGTREASSQGILLRLENRIYDRLETYTSDIPSSNLDFGKSSRLETSMEMDIQASSLKSTRLVMDLTRNSKLSKFIIDPEISRIYDDEEFFQVDGIVDFSMRKNQEDSTSLYLDWENDNEVKSIMLAPENQDSNFEERNIDDHEFTHCNSLTEPEKTFENNESLTIVREEIDKKEFTSEKDSRMLRRKASLAENYDVVGTDAENNQVVLKVVTIHEPTIARVENEDFLKKMKKPSTKKKISKIVIPTKKNCPIEHTYVNVFTGSDHVPIYENYKISDKNCRTNGKFNDWIKKTETKPSTEKMSRVEDKTPRSSSRHNSITLREGEKMNFEKMENTIVEKSNENSGFLRDSSIDKKKRIKGSDEKALDSKEKSSSRETSSTLNNSPGNSRLKTSKNLKNSKTEKSSVKSQNSIVSSTERDLRLSNSKPSKSDSRETSSTRMRKNENRPKPMEVVYQTAVYNMKNEKLSKPQKGKESKGPRYLNELICGAKTKRPSESKSKSSGTIQHSAKSKGAPQTIRHWK